MNKKALGGIIILGGIAFIGYILFKRNKPIIGSNQLEKLKTESTNLLAGADNIDKPFEASSQPIAPIKGLFEPDYTNLTPKQKEELKNVVQQSCPLCSNLDFGANLSNQISQNLQNSDLIQLGNLGLENINWSNIKISKNG